MSNHLRICLLLLVCSPSLASEPKHGFAYFGKLKYTKDVAHFDYTNPDAPKGGTVRTAEVATFNNLHSFVDKGSLAYYVEPRLGAIIYDPLMKGSEDELGAYYCRLCETVEVADDYSWVEYTLRQNAYWHDGQPVTMEDVLWTFDIYKTKASITWRAAFSEVERLEQTGPWSFKFHFTPTSEKSGHLIIQTAVFTTLPKHYWKDRKFDATTLEPPLGNGPYKVDEVDPGHSVSFERVKDYWAKDLNFTRGMYNFDRIESSYYFDKSVMLQALRADLFDLYREQDETFFHTAYDFDASRAGLFLRKTYKMGVSYGMHYGIVLNQRRDVFNDIRVREAVTLAYNFEWANRVYYHGGLARNNSYFMRSGLQAKGLPSNAELALLEPYRDQLPARVFTDPVDLPKNESSGRNRDTLLRAHELLHEAGWVIRDFVRVNEKTGEPLTIDFVVSSNLFERSLTPFVENLKRLGIHAVIRKIENNLMVNRLRSYDYDATIRKFYTYLIPFPYRMRQQFTSQYADTRNMLNYAGIKNPVVDILVEKIAQSRTEEAMNTAGRALDRTLLWNFYLIPDGHPVGRHLLYWDRFGHTPLGAEYINWTGFPQLWWFDEDKDARIKTGLAELNKQ